MCGEVKHIEEDSSSFVEVTDATIILRTNEAIARVHYLPRSPFVFGGMVE